MKTVYLSLGSNLGDREQTIRDAIRLLEGARLRVLRVSQVYETEPMEKRNQPFFLNVAVEAETDLLPMQLLAHAQRVEKQLGRRRLVPKGPRTIDIDILFYGNSIIDSPQLTIPHPAIAERRFVLEPLADLAPHLRHPITRQTVLEMLASTTDQSVRKFHTTAGNVRESLS